MSAHDFIVVSLRSYQDERARQGELVKLRFPGLTNMFLGLKLRCDGNTFEPDGGMFLEKFGGFEHQVFTLLSELKNGLGEEGCDPVHQTSLYYMRIVASDTVCRSTQFPYGSTDLLHTLCTKSSIAIYATCPARLFFSP